MHVIELIKTSIILSCMCFTTVYAGPGEPYQTLLPEIPKVHLPAPLFTAETIGGENISLAALQGKPILIHFWATFYQKNNGLPDSFGLLEWRCS